MKLIKRFYVNCRFVGFFMEPLIFLFLGTCDPVFQYDSAISRLVTTADKGNPLPIGFPSVTMSGITPPS